MEWNSPDPEYSEFLTKEQMDQVQARREASRQKLVLAATRSDPVRENYASDENNQKAVDRRDAALEALKGSGMTAEEMKQLINQRYGPLWKLDADEKEAVRDRRCRIDQEFGQN